MQDPIPKRERHWFQSRNIALLQCSLTLATTTISWLIAYCLGHVKLWPIPMVSYCGVHAPERYVFTMGGVCSAFLMFLFIWVIETADKIYSSKTTAWLLGFPCSIGLMLLAVCNCQDEPTAHYIGAVAYFGCFALWCVCCSFKEIGLEGNDLWPRVRKILAVMIMIMTAIMLYLLAVKDKVDAGRIPVLEWSAVICSELFVGSFWFDLGDDFYIEQVEVKGRAEAIKKQKKIESVQLSEDKTTGWVILRQIFSLLVLFFTICLASLYLLGFQGTDWQVGVSEWAAVFSAEFYCATFYWDLGKEFLVEQVREVLGKAWWVRFGQERGWWTGKGSQPGDYMLLQDDEPFSDLP